MTSTKSSCALVLTTCSGILSCGWLSFSHSSLQRCSLRWCSRLAKRFHFRRVSSDRARWGRIVLEKIQRDLRFQIRKDFQRPRVIFFERYLDLIKQPSFVPPQPVMIPGEHLKLLRLFGVGLKSTQMNVIGSKKFRQHISIKGITLGLAHAKAISGPIQAPWG